MPEETEKKLMTPEEFASIIRDYIDLCEKRSQRLAMELEFGVTPERQKEIEAIQSVINQGYINSLMRKVKAPAYRRIMQASHEELICCLTDSEQEYETQIAEQEEQIRKLNEKLEKIKNEYFETQDLVTAKAKREPIDKQISECNTRITELRGKIAYNKSIKELPLEDLKSMMLEKIGVSSKGNTPLDRTLPSTHDMISKIICKIAPEDHQEVIDLCGRLNTLLCHEKEEGYITEGIIEKACVYNHSSECGFSEAWFDQAKATERDLLGYKEKANKGIDLLDTKIEIIKNKEQEIKEKNETISTAYAIIDKIKSGTHTSEDLDTLKELADKIELGLDTYDYYTQFVVVGFIAHIRELSNPKIANAKGLFASKENKATKESALSEIEKFKINDLYQGEKAYVRKISGNNLYGFHSYEISKKENQSNNKYDDAVNFMESVCKYLNEKKNQNKEVVASIDEKLESCKAKKEKFATDKKEIEERLYQIIGTEIPYISYFEEHHNGYPEDYNIAPLYINYILSTPKKYEEIKQRAEMLEVDKKIDEQIKLQASEIEKQEQKENSDGLNGLSKEELLARKQFFESLINATNNPTREASQPEVPSGPKM